MSADPSLLLLIDVHDQNMPYLVGRACKKQILGVVAHRYEVVGLLFRELEGWDDVQYLKREEINEVNFIGECDNHFFESYLHGEYVGLEGDICNDVVTICLVYGVLSSKIAMRYDTNAEF